MAKETYSMEAHCRNCKEVWTVYIPIGITVEMWEKKIVCERCQCGDVIIQREMRFR